MNIFKRLFHIHKWKTFTLTTYSTRLHRSCIKCGRHQVSNSIYGSKHSYWINK